MNALEIHLTPIMGGLIFGLLALLSAGLFYWATARGYREAQRRGFALGFRDGRRSEREAVQTVRAVDWAAHHSRILLRQAHAAAVKGDKVDFCVSPEGYVIRLVITMPTSGAPREWSQDIYVNP